MLRFQLGDRPGQPLSVLCLGAHSDDIEIGAGGTILRLLSERPGSSVRWVVFSANDEREDEARASAEDFLVDAASSEVIVHRFRESYFPYVGAEVKDAFEALKSGPTPDVVLTHRRDDEHQDHRTIASLAWNTFRDHVVAEYEIPKFEGDLGHPNLYVPLSDEIAGRKVDLLMRHFGTQRSKRWFRRETFEGLMSLRGVESNSTWAEAHHCRKLLVS